MEWSEELIARLRDLWAEGHSTAEIGRRLSVSKNAVVGKAHRLDLPARPSPIRRDGERKPRRPAPRRGSGPTLPPLSCTQQAPLSDHVPSPSISPRLVERVLPSAPRPSPAVVLRAAPIPKTYGRVFPCCWPIGEPGTREFRFCDADSLPGKPYCAEHAQLAYVKVRDRREDAA